MTESPSWKKPSDIMKLRMKRRTLSRGRSVDSQENKTEAKSARPVSPAPAVKRRNPFGNAQNNEKRVALEKSLSLPQSNETKPSEAADSFLFSALDATRKQQVDQQSSHPTTTLGLSELEAKVTQGLQSPQSAHAQTTSVSSQPNEVRVHDYFPVDWSLRTKMRFFSKKPFNWCCNLRSVEESAGTAAFTRGLPDQITETVEHPATSNEAKSDFHRHCHLWMHPNLPWLKLFPRIVADSKLGTSNLTQSETIQAAILSDWTTSFTSLFHELRCTSCPYFYVCTHQFAVLFRAAGVNTRSQMHAIITPTSRGFRESLKKEGIEFTMPLLPKTADEELDELEPEESTCETEKSSDASAEKESSEVSTGDEPGDEDKDIADTDDGASSWLESIGLNAAKFRTLDPAKIKMSREGFKVIDHRPESMVLVDGADTQALFNFLLNCRSCIATSGNQTGIPPTLLSPVSFKGATLNTLKVKSHYVRQGAGTEAGYSLEVTGPILPSAVHGLTQLFSHTHGSFSSMSSIHQPSMPFNVVAAESKDTPQEEVPEKLKNCGVQLTHLESLMRNYDLGKQGIVELTCSDKQYSWFI